MRNAVVGLVVLAACAGRATPPPPVDDRLEPILAVYDLLAAARR